MILFLKLFFKLLCGHVLADYALQTEAMERGKSSEGNLYGVPWYYWLGAHSLIQGGVVLLITNSYRVAIIETVFHFVVDRFKCRGSIGIHEDQILHIGMKLVYSALLIFFPI
jgi:hypothetical protein